MVWCQLLVLFVFCLQGNANDCSDAQSLAVPSSLAGSNVNEGEIFFSDTCNSISANYPSSWFRITPAVGTLISLSTCTSCFDTILSVFTSNCSDLSCYTTNDDSSEICSNSMTCDDNSSGLLTSSVSFCTSEPEYFILLTGFNGATGTFQLEIKEDGPCEVPQNNACSAAFQVDRSLPQNFPFHNEFASGGSNQCGNVKESEHSVWYRVGGTGGTIIVSTCDVTTNFPTAVAVFSGECGNLDCVASNDVNIVSCPLQQLSWLEFCSEIGKEYFIMVSGKEGSFGSGLLSIADGTSSTCEIGSYLQTIYFSNHSYDLVGENGRCTSPHEIRMENGEFSLSGQTVIDATSAVDFPSCFTSNSDKDTIEWFSFQGAGNSIFLNTYYSDFDTVISVFTGTCFDLDCVVWNDDYYYLQAAVSFCAEAGVDYLIGIGSFGLNTGSYDLHISEFGPCIQQSSCEDVSMALNIPSTTNGDLDILASIPFPYSTCNSAPIGNQNAWFKVVGLDSRLSVTTCNSCFDTVLTIFESLEGCQNLRCIAANNDHRGECYEDTVNECTNTYTSALSFCAGAEKEYFIVVSGFLGESGLVTVNIIDEGIYCLPNDNCEFATAVTYDEWQYVQTYYGQENSYLDCNDVEEGHGSAWYTLEGSGGLVHVDIAPYYDYDDYEGNSASVVIYTSESGACLNQNFDTCLEGEVLTSGRISFCTKPGNLYWIGIGALLREESELKFIVSEGGSCMNTDNQICNTATPIHLHEGLITSGNTEFSGGEALPFICDGILFEAPSQVWYSFIGNGKLVDISTCGSDFNTIIAVLEDSCEFRSCAAQNDDSCGTASSLQFCAISGIEYFVVLGGYSQQSGDFLLSIQEGITCPGTDICSQSINIVVPFSFSGSTLLATKVDVIENVIPLTSCLISGANDITNTQWYTFRSSRPHLIEVWAGYSDIPIVLGLFFSNCDIHASSCIPFVSGTSVEYLQTVCGDSSNDYYLMVAGEGDARGDYSIEINYLEETCSLLYDVSTCSEALYVPSLPHRIFGDTSYGIPFFDASCYTSVGNGVSVFAAYHWLVVVGSGSVITIDYTYSPEDLNLHFDIYTSCTADECIEVEESASSLSFCGIPGQNFFIKIGSLGNHNTGKYEIALGENRVCVAVPEPPLVVTISKSTTSFTFHWEIPFSYEFPILSYEYSLHDTTGQNIAAGQTDPNTLAVTISSLFADTMYEFTIHAISEWGRGEAGRKMESTMTGSCQSNFVDFESSVPDPTSIDNLKIRGHIITPESNARVYSVEVQSGRMPSDGFMSLYLYENIYGIDDLFEIIEKQNIEVEVPSHDTIYFEGLDWYLCANKRYFIAVVTNGEIISLPDVTSMESCVGEYIGISVDAEFLGIIRTSIWYDSILDSNIYQIRMDVDILGPNPVATAPSISNYFTTVTSATISWRQPCSDTPVTGYSIRISPEYEEIILAAKEVEYNFRALSGATSYTIEIRAINSHGIGDTTLQEITTLEDRYSIQWLRQSSGFGDISVTSLAIDMQGNSFVVGNFYDRATFGDVTMEANRFVSDSFLVKYSPEGTVLWAIHLGRSLSGSSDIRGVSVNSEGNVFVIGSYQSNIQLADNQEPIRIRIPGTVGVYLASYTNTGTFLDFKHIGDELGFDVFAGDVTHDSQDRLIILMYSNSIFVRFYEDAFEFNAKGNGALLAVYSTSLILEHVATITGVRTGESVTSDMEGNIYVTGSYGDEENVFIGDEEAFLPIPGITNVFIAKFNNHLAYEWFRGLNNAISTSIQVNSQMSVLALSGSFDTQMDDTPFALYSSSDNSEDFIEGEEIVSLEEDAAFAPFVIAFDPSTGDLLWINTVSFESSSGSILDITFTSNGNIVGTGSYLGDLAFGDDYQGIPFPTAQESSAYFVGFDSIGGNLSWSRWAGSQFYSQWGITIDSLGDLVVAGGTFAGIASFDCTSTVAADGFDVYITQLLPSGQTNVKEIEILPSCEYEVLHDPTGTIHFPPVGFSIYPNFFECSWLIDVDDVPHIMGILIRFELADGDYLTFFDGDHIGAPVLHHYGGNTALVNEEQHLYFDDYYHRSELQIQSSTSKMLIKFTSDGCIRGFGFTLNYASAQTASFCDPDFDQTLTLPSGLVSQRQKGGYKDKSDCYFFVQPPSSQFVLLSFLQFDLATDDYIEFLDESSSEVIVIARFYGGDVVFPIQSLNSRITVHFVSNDALYEKGFILEYEGINDPLFCVPLLVTSDGGGEILSQEKAQLSYSPSASCSWNIDIDFSLYDSVYLYFDTYDVPAPGEVNITQTAHYGGQPLTLPGSSNEVFISDTSLMINFNAHNTQGSGFHGEYCGHPIGGACSNEVLTDGTERFNNHFCGLYYESNSRCEWEFRPEVAGPIHYIMLSFSDVDFQNEDSESPDDFISIRTDTEFVDIVSQSADDLLALPTYIIHADAISILFQSDGSINGRGFDALACASYEGSPNECSGVTLFQDPEGTFTNQFCGTIYNSDATCIWKFESKSTPTFTMILLRNLAFADEEWNGIQWSDHVAIYAGEESIRYFNNGGSHDGKTMLSDQEDGETIKESEVIAIYGDASVSFISDSIGFADGFDGSFCVFEEADARLCKSSQIFTASDGAFHNHACEKYYQPDAICTFSIHPPSTGNEEIILYITSADFINDDSNSLRDFMTIYDGPLVESQFQIGGFNKSAEYYQNEALSTREDSFFPRTFFALSGKMSVLFHSDSSGFGEGFDAEYCTLQKPAATCGGDTLVTESSLRFKDHLCGPSYYRPMDCRWIFQPSDTNFQFMVFVFHALDLGDGAYISIYDSSSDITYRSDEFLNNKEEGTQIVEGSAVFLSTSFTEVQFVVSNSAILKEGWDIEYLTVTNTGICEGENQFGEAEGYITDHIYGDFYAPDLQCSFLIEIPTARAITVRFEYFDLEEGFDFLEIYDGNGWSAELIGFLSGNELPLPFTSSSNALYFTFRSDGSVNHRGFRLFYQDADEVECKLFCSGFGICQDGQCECEEDRFGSGCEILPAPIPAIVQFFDTLETISLVFDKPTNRANMFGSTSTDCSILFHPEDILLLGSDARCVWKSNQQLLIRTGNGATILPDHTITLQGGIQEANPSEDFPSSIARTIQIAGPNNPIVPIPVIVGTDVLLPKRDLRLDSSATLFSGGRPLSFEWNLNQICLDSICIPPGEELRAWIEAEDSAQLFISADYIAEYEANSTFYFECTARNFLGLPSSEPSRHSVVVSDVALPGIVFTGPRKYNIDRNEELLVNTYINFSEESFQRIMDSCPDIQWSWQLSCLSGSCQEILYDNEEFPTDNQPSIYFEPDFFRHGASYRLVLSVSYVEEATLMKLENQSEVFIEINPFQLDVEVIGGTQVFSILQDIPLVAELNEKQKDLSEHVNYRWACRKESGYLCQKLDSSFLSLEDRASVLIPRGSLPPGEYVFHVIAIFQSEDISLMSESRSSVAIRILRKDQPIVSITRPGLRVKHDPRLPFVLYANVDSSVLSMQWSVVEGDLILSSALQSPTSTATELVIAPNTLQDGATYRFQVEVESQSGSNSAEYEILINEGPSAGTINMEPQFGFSVQTEFTFSASASDDREDMPLHYVFSLLPLSCSGVELPGGRECPIIPVSNQQNFPRFSALLPPGEFFPVVDIFDRLGAFTRYIGTEKITSYNSCPATANRMVQFMLDLSVRARAYHCLGAVEKIRQLVNIASVTLNCYGEDVPQEALDLYFNELGALLVSVSDSVPITKIYVDNRVKSFMLSSSLSSFGGRGNVGKLLRTSAAIANAAKEKGFLREDSAQSLLTGLSNVLNSSDLGANDGASVLIAIQGVTGGLLLHNTCGNIPSSLSSTNIDLQSQRQSKLDLAGSIISPSGSGASFTLPSDTNSLGSDCVNYAATAFKTKVFNPNGNETNSLPVDLTLMDENGNIIPFVSSMPIEIRIPKGEATEEELVCASWDEENAVWVNDCTFVGETEDVYILETSHLTSFAVLLGGARSGGGNGDVPSISSFGSFASAFTGATELFGADDLDVEGNLVSSFTAFSAIPTFAFDTSDTVYDILQYSYSSSNYDDWTYDRILTIVFVALGIIFVIIGIAAVEIRFRYFKREKEKSFKRIQKMQLRMDSERASGNF